MDDHTAIPIQVDPTHQRMVGTTMHGGISFDVPYINEIAENLWQGGCMAGLVLPTHINYVVSLYPWERYTMFHKVRGELYIRMYDDPNQALDQIDEIADQVNRWRDKGVVLVHCQAGLNRSSLVVARALMKEGLSADEAINLLRDKRSPAVLCNPAFEAWLRKFNEVPHASSN
jgi:protein-tyrosine phosphatase